jgi:hypothetical protein
MDKVFASWPNLTDQPISHLDVEYFTDGSSFVQDSTHFAGYIVVTLSAVTEACPLPVRTSAQKAELIALMRVVQLTAGVWVNTNIFVHGTLYKERGLTN